MTKESIYKIKTWLRRKINEIQKIDRPSSYPYLSGDGFRVSANFIYDQFLDFDPIKVEYGDVIFVRNNYLKDFFKLIHPKIKEKYVLISHNEDCEISNSYENYIDEKIIHWYTQNTSFKNPKITLLPIGIQNFMVGKEENFINYYLKIKKESIDKKNRIIFGFNKHPNIPERDLAFEFLSKSNLADHIKESRAEYYKKIQEYKFIASPRGGGLDCHRTWEALYFRTIPILIKNDFSDQIQDLGFPVLLLNDWGEVLNLKENDLLDYYENNKKYFDNSKLYLDY